MSSGSTDQAKLIQFSAFLDHGPHVLITKLFQPSHNGVIPTVKELSEIFWHTIRALANNLHQFIHIFKSHSLCKDMLNPSVNFRLANSFIRHMWIRFLEKLIMLNNGFHRRRWWVRHIGSSCKLIDYLKTVEFYTLKTTQCKKDINCPIRSQVTNVLHFKT